MVKHFISFLLVFCFLTTACSNDDSALWTTYRGYFTESEGGMIYDFFQEPDTTVLVLNASDVPCDYTETVEEVSCGDTPVYMGKTYTLSLSDTRAQLSIGSAAHKYNYVADKRTRTWSYHPGEYSINLTGYEKCKKMANVFKAVVYRNHLTFKKQIRFYRKNGDKEELAFVANGDFSYVEYGPKRMHKVDIPASIEAYDLAVSKEDEYNWILTGEETAYRFHVQERLLIQTKPVYKKHRKIVFYKLM